MLKRFAIVVAILWDALFVWVGTTRGTWNTGITEAIVFPWVVIGVVDLAARFIRYGSLRKR